MKKTTLAAAFSGLIALCAAAGILLQCGLFSGRLDLSVLTYFTLMSNIGCAVYYAALAIHKRKRDTAPLPTLKGMLQLCITVTGVVYQLMLAGRFEMQGTLAVSNALLHQVVPIAVNLNWLIFDRKPSYTWKMPFVWLLAPLCYAFFVYISTAMGAVLGPYGQVYPYYFMDPAQVGGVGILLLIDVVMGVCFLLMGLLFVALDRWIGKNTPRLLPNKNQLLLFLLSAHGSDACLHRSRFVFQLPVQHTSMSRHLVILPLDKPFLHL